MCNVSSLIWGIFVLLFGISLIVQAVTGISIPLARVFAGLFLICIGYNLIFKKVYWWDKKRWRSCTSQMRQHCDSNTFSPDQRHYSISFSSANIDLSRRNFEHGAVYEVQSSTTFGSTMIKVPQDVVIELSVSANFAHVVLPDGTKMMTGTQIVRPSSFNEQTQFPVLRLYIDAFCGEVKIYF